FGQASSKVGGGTSPGSEAGGAAATGGRRSGADGSVVRASARSRSLRDDEENSRLRRGLTTGAASTGSGAAGTSTRPGSRGAACSCHGGGDAGCPADSTTPAFSAAGWPRLSEKAQPSGARVPS